VAPPPSDGRKRIEKDPERETKEHGGQPWATGTRFTNSEDQRLREQGATSGRLESIKCLAVAIAVKRLDRRSDLTCGESYQVGMLEPSLAAYGIVC